MVREVVEHGDNVLRDVRAVVPLLGQPVDLGLRGHVAGEQEPEETLRQGLGTAGRLGQLLLALRDRVAAEADALVGVEDRGLGDEALDAAHATVRHVNGNVAYLEAAVLLAELGHTLLLLGHQIGQHISQVLET